MTKPSLPPEQWSDSDIRRKRIRRLVWSLCIAFVFLSIISSYGYFRDRKKSRFAEFFQRYIYPQEPRLAYLMGIQFYSKAEKDHEKKFNKGNQETKSDLLDCLKKKRVPYRVSSRSDQLFIYEVITVFDYPEEMKKAEECKKRAGGIGWVVID